MNGEMSSSEQSLVPSSQVSPETLGAQACSSSSGGTAKGTTTTPSDVVLFLGAGASAAGGYRTFFTFPHMFWPTPTEPAKLGITSKANALLLSIKNELQRQNRPETMDHYLWILNSYHAALTSVFASPELRTQFADSLLVFSRLKEVSDCLNTILRKICALTTAHYSCPPDRNYATRVFGFYDRLLELQDLLCVFTTNYDLTPEYIFSSEFRRFGTQYHGRPTFNFELDTKGIHFCNGVKDFCKIRADDFRESRTDGHEQMQPDQKKRFAWDPQNYYRPNDSKAVFYYRLHGCVAWFYDQMTLQGSEVFFDFGSMENIDEAYGRLCVMYPGRPETPGVDPHCEGFRQLYERVLRARTIVFIGFSMRDADVMRCILGSIYRLESGGQQPGTLLDKKRLVIIDEALDQQEIRMRFGQVKQGSPIPLADPCADCEIIVERQSFPPVTLEEEAALMSRILGE